MAPCCYYGVLGLPYSVNIWLFTHAIRLCRVFLFFFLCLPTVTSVEYHRRRPPNLRSHTNFDGGVHRCPWSCLEFFMIFQNDRILIDHNQRHTNSWPLPPFFFFFFAFIFSVSMGLSIQFISACCTLSYVDEFPLLHVFDFVFFFSDKHSSPGALLWSVC